MWNTYNLHQHFKFLLRITFLLLPVNQAADMNRFIFLSQCFYLIWNKCIFCMSYCVHFEGNVLKTPWSCLFLISFGVVIVLLRSCSGWWWSPNVNSMKSPPATLVLGAHLWSLYKLVEADECVGLKAFSLVASMLLLLSLGSLLQNLSACLSPAWLSFSYSLSLLFSLSSFCSTCQFLPMTRDITILQWWRR